MATADAMFPRVKDLFESASTPTLARIAHGRAILNSFYQESRQPYAAEIYDTDHKTGGLTAGSWFLGRHRALLAPVAVGTVDQLLSSVLRHKYNFLRLVGAATKTVVLDEVHSYDPYQSRLLERFLEWAGFLSIDTVVLSATLPTRRVNAYIAAYARGTNTTIEDLGTVPYPSVITLAEDEVTIDDLSGQESGRERHVAVTYASVAQPAVGAVAAVRAARAVAPSAKIGVIVNTVAAAQAVGAELADQHPLVLHSRLPANERSARTSDAIIRFGTGSTAGADLLVATQIAEQSLDVDFDILITELCPAASLLQRIGRLWRHDDPDRRPRPPELKSATVTIIHPETLSVAQRAFLPYSSAEIHKTWALGLHHGTRASIDVPGDVQQMVNDADVTVEDLIDGADPLSELHFAAEMAATLIADSRLIPTPARVEGRLGAELAGFSSGAIGNEETATRWSETDSVVILPLSTRLDGCWTGMLPATADTETARDLLGHTIPLNGVAATRLLAAANPAPNSVVRKEWNTHPLLRDIVAVDFDNYPSLYLDPLLGLILRKDSGP
jgi:CRISPR-associated endonuclease/helicase Cas3